VRSGPVFVESDLKDEIVSETRTLHLPAELCAQAEARFGKKFGGIENLLEFVLRDLLRDDAARLDEAEKLLVEQRLRDLGYL
jgi:hypothetical protein